MSTETLSQIWGKLMMPGEKAIANWDEDSLTMAVEAVVDCLGNIDRSIVDGLYFASTTPSYREKQNASIVAKVVDLRRDIATMDISNSIRSGTSAMRAALDAVNAGSAQNIMVASSDCRVPAPDSDFENYFGDGAAAILLGNTDVAVEIEGSYTMSSDFLDIWRRENDRYVRTWEDRFVFTQGYYQHMGEIIAELFNRYKVSNKDFDKVILYGHDQRRHFEMCRRLGFDLKTQVQDPLLTTVGNAGSASVLMMLVAALEAAKPGDRLLLAGYGDGADAYILKVTDKINGLRNRRGVKKHLARKMIMPSYGKYIHFRNLMEWQARPEPSNYAPLTMSWRDRNWILSFKGNKCNKCHGIQFPPQRICTWCQSKDDFEEIRLSDRKGIVYTYSMDNLAVSIDPPVVNTIVNLDGGGRVAAIMTDRDVNKISTGMPVELTFRRFHEGQGIHNYFWKCRPIID